MTDVCDRRYEWSGEVHDSSLEIRFLVWISERSNPHPHPFRSAGGPSVSITGIFLLSKVALWVVRGQGFEVS